MKIQHQSFGGKCIFCGARTRSKYLIDSAPQKTEDIYDDCPKARFYCIIFFIFFMLPMIYLILDWEILLLGGVLGSIFFEYFLSPETGKWVGLRDVREEYEGLIANANPASRNFYKLLLGPVLRSLFALRDKAFKAQSLVLGESFEEIDFKIKYITNRSLYLDDPELAAMYRNQLEDLKENRQKIEQIYSLLEKFEANKNCMIESLRLLKNRILLTETNGGDEEELKIIEDLKSLHCVYDFVTNPQRMYSLDGNHKTGLEYQEKLSAEFPPQQRMLRAG